MLNDESRVKFEDLIGENTFSIQYIRVYIYGFTLTIELLFNTYNRLSLSLIYFKVITYRYLNFSIVYIAIKKVMCYFHTFILIFTLFDEF